MRLYLRLKDVLPPDGFQPGTELTFVDDDGGEVLVKFRTYDAMYDAARVLTDTADEAMRAHFQKRATRWGHLAEEITADERNAREDEDRVYDAMVDDARYFAGINDEVA